MPSSYLSLYYPTRNWDGSATPLVVIGRHVLERDGALAARLEPFAQSGGRVLICAQDPEWMTRALGWRVCPKVARRVFPIGSLATRGLDADDLRDWAGSSTLIEDRPQYAGDYLRGNEGDQPYAGWHWGNRGGVASAAIEKPHRSGWHPGQRIRTARKTRFQSDAPGSSMLTPTATHSAVGA